MTYDEITVFRRFLKDKGVLGNYEFFYKAHRYDKIELDYFLEQVEAEGAILRAFDTECAGNTIFSEKYWDDLNKKWIKRLRDFRLTGDMTSQELVQCQHCKRTLSVSAFVLGAHGLHKHCKECESGEWDSKLREQAKAEKERERKQKEISALEKEIADKQYALELRKAKLNGETTTKVCAHCGKRKLRSEFSPSDTSEDGLQSWCNRCQEKMTNVSDNADQLAERSAAKEEEVRPSAPRLGEYDATLHYKQAQKSITFNATLSELIREGHFTKCYLNTDRQQRHFLIFNHAEGANVSTLGHRSAVLSCVYSSDICSALAKHFQLKIGDSYYLHITRNLSRTADFITIEVLHYRTKEEYLAIAQRREEAENEEDNSQKTVSVKEVALFPATQKTDASEKPSDDFINFDFGTKVSAPPSAEILLQQLLDRHLATERDMAAFLHNRGWKLQEPITSYKKFTL